MKSTIYIAVTAIVLVMTASSCRKCQICTKDSAAEVRVCEKDYNNTTEYGVVIDGLELTGYNCR